jgi:hypothetical protein
MQCLLMASFLAGVLRGRGSAEAVAQRRERVQQLRKFASTALRLLGKPIITW